jgi:hypothetical protein
MFHMFYLESNMNFRLPLSQMAISEKLRTMEALWANLCENSDELAAPSWHGDILTERDSRVAEGTEKIYKWNDAKKNIRDSI